MPLPSCTPRVLFAVFSNGIGLCSVGSTQLSRGSCSRSCLVKSLTKVAASAFESWRFQWQRRPLLCRLRVWQLIGKTKISSRHAAFTWHLWNLRTQRFVRQSPPVHRSLWLVEKKLINLSPLWGGVGREYVIPLHQCQWQEHPALSILMEGGGFRMKIQVEWGPNACFPLAHRRKKTSTWWSTVAGCLSVGSPLFFRSGAQEFGEPGWWKLVHNKPPTMKPEGEKLSASALKAKGNSFPSV